MSFLKKLFGKKPEAKDTSTIRAHKPATLPPVKAQSENNSNQPSAPNKAHTIKVWDAYGRILEIPREEWRTKVMPDNFKKAWDKPDELANLIFTALNDGFISDSLAPARQLHKIDPQPKRGATYLVVVLIQLKQFDEAEKIITAAISKHGEDGTLLTNLAKVQSNRGQEAQAEKTLWNALEVDPNLDNGLMWYQAMYRERGGEEGAQEAFRRVAALPGSWRAQAWLARTALQSRDLDRALTLYQESLSRAGNPPPTELLQQMSGDLGNAAHLPELLRLTEPHFVPNIHGLAVGNNLIKAHLDLGQFEAARKILDQLYAQNRGDWKENLNYWETEMAKARLVISTASQGADMKVAMLAIEGPIWLKPNSPAGELFPAHASDDIKIAFLGCSSDVASNYKITQRQLADAPGRMSRALPLFLAEQITFASNASVQTLVPWIVNDSGFVLSGGPWKDEDAANHARQGEMKNDFVVTIHLKPTAEPWSAELRVIRTIDAKCIGTLNGTWAATNPEAGIPGIAGQLLAILAEQTDATSCPPPSNYQVPAGAHFSHYLLRLEQLLAVRCAGMDGVNNSFLNNEREIIDGNLWLCLENPQNPSLRILLAQTLRGIKKVRPNILPEFKDKIARLQKEKPLAEPAQSVVQRVINEVFTG